MTQAAVGPLLLTPGDPSGIGPEVACRALADGVCRTRTLLLGEPRAIRSAAKAAGLPLVEVDGPHLPPPPHVGLWVPSAGDDPIEITALRLAVDACQRHRASALVTGPIHKARLAAQGFGYAGHTDFLGALCGVDNPVMAFVGGRLRVALVTVHIPLRAVPDALTPRRILHTIRTSHEALVTQVDLPAPRLAVCGLNPHAGDQGLLGSEDDDVVAPAIAQARALGVDAVGPWSAEAAFGAAMRGDVDMVVAMYHDQGLAPLKAVDFGRSVNWTLGLPIVRTSVDHGTGDDLVGTGRASAESMKAALSWAATLVDRPRGPTRPLR